MAYELIAAVDLGSNSFRLQVGRIVANQIYPLDGLKESVRLAAGLNSDKRLDAASQQRGVEALSRFAERLRDFDQGAVRAVATNTLRVAKNAEQFLEKAEAALGFPIEVIAGREEARLIYLGVAHTLANPQTRQLVVDIGGGSTEFVIGQSMDPIRLESLYMGCVSFSLRFFPDGRVDKRSFKDAELAARRELQAIVHAYRETGWDGEAAQRALACGRRLAHEIAGPSRRPHSGTARRSGDHVRRIQGIRTGTHGVLGRRPASGRALRSAGALSP
jgi:exopolyphosphatase/guanosine-5'-triphosphate,3'-diphosphate pyrophosphatase